MHKSWVITWLKFLAVAGLYILTARLSLLFFAPDGSASVFFIASGLALAVMLYGGREHLWAILLGAVLLNLLQGKAWLAAVLISVGSAAGAWLGAWLLRRMQGFDISLPTLRDYLLLIGLGGCAACSLPALIGVLTLWSTQSITSDAVFTSLLYWWMGDTLGVILIAPLLLVWWHNQDQHASPKQYPEAILIVALNVLVGQLVFLDWFHDSIGDYAKNYWIFLFVSWAAVRLGSRATTLILVIAATQAMVGLMQQRLNFIDPNLGDRHAINYWFFMVALSVVGMALSTYFSERQRTLNAFRDQKELLRTLLQSMPDVVWLKNPDGVYILCNHNFEALYGITEAQIIGKTDNDFVSAEMADLLRENDAKAIAAGKPCSNEEWLRLADETHTGLYETTKTPVFSSGGLLIGVLGVAHDITQLRETQVELRERIKQQACLHAVFRLTEDLQKPLSEVLQAVVELLPSGWFYPEIAAASIEWNGQRYSSADFQAAENLQQTSICINGREEGSVTVVYLQACSKQQEEVFRHEEQALLNAVAERLASSIQYRRTEENARQREEIFRAIVAQAAESITLLDANTLQFIEFNDAACQGLGYSREEFSRLSLSDIQGEFDTPTLERRIRKFKEAGGAAQFDTLRRHKNGSFRHVHVSLKIITLQGRDYLSIIWSDITERKQIEEQFRHLFAHNPAPMLIYQRGALAVIAVNDAFIALYGYSQEEAQSLQLTDLYTEQDKAAITALAADLHGFAKVGEWRHILKDKTLIDIISSSHDIHFADRACRVMVMTDISERKQAEAELRKLWLAVEQSPNSIVITNLNAEIEYVNQRFTEVTGYSAGEALGQNPRILQSGHTSKASYDEMWQQLTQGHSWAGELVNRRKDGREYVEWAQITPVRQADGRITHYLAIKEDITDKKLAEAELATYRHHLEELVAARTLELEQARRESEAANIAKSQFLANMSHEIRTPMNAILGMLYLALKQELPPGLHNHLSKAQGAAHSLLNIINDILDFSKIEAGKLEMETIEFGLDSVVEQLTDAIGLQAEQKGIEFLIRYDAAIPSLLIGDPFRLKQILLNLCGNAIKFTEQGEVELAFHLLSRKENQIMLQITVRDTGMGMEQDLQDRLFQKFTQADQSTTRRFGGTGLGLAITKQLIELMGGRIWIEDSEPGKGSTLCCTVQLDISQQAERHRRELLAQAAPLLAGIKVLVVDDNEVSREILAEMLRFFQLEVSVVANGSRAIQVLENESAQAVDLVLMDWRMPTMNGDETTRRIHASLAIKKQPKIIMVTAYGREDVMRLAEQAGVEGFLIKPVAPSTLLDAVLNALGRDRILGRQDNRAPACTLSLDHCAGARLLLVEDNDINREFAVELLHSVNIYADEAVNGEEAVTKVQQQHYDGVLMDIQMPVMDGLEASRRIRALAAQSGNAYYAKLPIIAMTALAMPRDEEAGRAAGMNDHVTKPIDPERFFAVLNKWLAHTAIAAADRDNALSAGGAALPVELHALQSVNASEGIRRIGGKASAYRRQLQRFCEHYSDAVSELQRLLQAQGYNAAENYCHALKGVTGNIGAHLLYDCLSAIDDLLKRQQMPDAAVFEQLDSLLRQLIAEIDGLAITAPLPPMTGVAMSREQMLDHIAQLGQVLETDLGAAEALLLALRAGAVGTELETDMNQIAAEIDVFNIDSALSLLSALHLRLLTSP